jgi:hypothetical protein
VARLASSDSAKSFRGRQATNGNQRFYLTHIAALICMLQSIPRRKSRGYVRPPRQGGTQARLNVVPLIHGRGFGVLGSAMLFVCLGFLSLEALAQNGGVITFTVGSGGSGVLAYMQVNIGPKEALAAGAQWKVRGADVWYSNPPWTAALAAGGSAVLEFKPVTNWDLPPNQNLTLTLGKLTTASALYTRSAQLAVRPAGGLASSGRAGGPFKPAKVTYTLSNSGGARLSWKGTTTTNWLSLSATNGTLAAGARTNITVTINANANSLAVGTYTNTINFINLTNALGNANRSVRLVVLPTAQTKQDPT